MSDVTETLGSGGRRLDPAGKICIGVDVGGTFTDAVVTDGSGTWRAKAPTTPGDVGRGVLDAVRLAAQRSGHELEAVLPGVRRFGLGTTAVTNVLASRAGLRVGLLTTEGFEALVPLARGRRLNDDEGWLAPPPEIVDPDCVVGVAERIDRDGTVLVPIDVDDVVAAARRLVDEAGVEAFAISFLWSFRNPVHEDQAAHALRQAFPDLPVTAGSELYPAIREYERTTFAVLNAYTAGAFAGVEDLAKTLESLGLRVPLLLVHSAGGSITIGEARRVPVGLAESGPAAGVAACVTVAAATGTPDVVTCDMGGTSFDVSIVAGGQPTRRTRGELMGIWTALSLVDLESIGAGGGSIGWSDARSMLRVGPRSAGSQPGPACYGRGGTSATVTDALVVLGYLDPARFLGGGMRLDEDAAFESCARLGAQLGLDAGEAAWGIRHLALTGMVKAVRGRLASRGLDPRAFGLLSFGGCGALFTPEIARELGSPRVLVPELASVLSAFGAATTDVRRERLRAVDAAMPADAELLEKLTTELGAGIDDDLAADGIPADRRRVVFEADLRFRRQVWELAIPLRDGPVTPAAVDAVLEDFRAEYALRYGRGSLVLGAPIELVSLRAVGTGVAPRASLDAGHGETVPDGTPAEAVDHRRVRVQRAGDGDLDVDVYAGAELRTGHTLTGPALVDGTDTTIWVPEATTMHVDRHGTFVLEPVLESPA